MFLNSIKCGSTNFEALLRCEIFGRSGGAEHAGEDQITLMNLKVTWHKKKEERTPASQSVSNEVENFSLMHSL